MLDLTAEKKKITPGSAAMEKLHIAPEDVDDYSRRLGRNMPELATLLSGAMPIGVIGGYCEEGFPLYFVNREMCQMMGYDSLQEFETAIQGKVANTIYHEDMPRVTADLGDDYYPGKQYTTTYRMPRRDGSLFWVLDKGRVVNAQDGRLAILSYCMDITEIMEQLESQQQAVADLKQRNYELQYLNNTIPVGYHRCADTPDLDFIYISNRFAAMLGYTRQEIRDRFHDQFRAMVHPDDWARLFSGEENRSRLRNGGLCCEYRILARDGYRWVMDQTEYVTGLDASFFQCTIQDITERVHLREELKASVKAFRIAAQEAGSLVFTYNRREQTIYCDEEIAQAFGVAATQRDVPYGIVARGDVVTKDTEETYIRVHEAILAGEQEASGLVKLTDFNGSEAVYNLHIQTVTDDDGRPTDLAVGVYTDITNQYRQLEDLQRSAKDLRSARERLRAESQEQMDMIYALSRDYYALWLLDMDKNEVYLRRSKNFRSISASDTRQLPASYTENLAQFARNMVHPEDRSILLTEAALENIRRQLQEHEAFSVRVRRRTPDSEEYTYVEWRIVHMPSVKASHTALIAVKNLDGDVLDEARRQALLKDALAQAEHASRAKTTFLSNMSHDIRTPMNAIIGFTSIAASHLDNTERVRDCLEKIMASSNHLLSLINDILDMSRIESGKITIQEKECNLSERIHNLVNMVRPQMRAKGLDFYVDTIDVRDEELIFDPLRLDQVLINILSNAVKFTPMGGAVSFIIRQESSPVPGCARYRFIVKDTGIGMTPDFLARIFEPFERERSSTASGIEGTGLGMPIAKHTVEMMGGTIDIQSAPGQGSTFTVCFDFVKQDVAARQEQLKELEGLRALVVDDDFNICDSVTKMLSQIGMRSEWTTSGREAIFRAQKAHDDGDPFHSYIIDWLMPQMDGLETVRRIRRVIGDEAPIIILTAYDWTDIEEEARAAGVTAFCSKPIFMSDLRTVMMDASRGAGCAAPEPKAETARFSGRRVLVVEDNALNREIAQEILCSAGLTVETASDGSVAVEMLRSAPEGYYDLILMDIQMPLMDGYEATRAIRYLPRQDAALLPIVAMTANAFDEDRERCLKSGMNGHVAKPLNVDVLLSTIDRLLQAQAKA